MAPYKIIDLLWKLDFPVSIIFAFLVFFIPLKKKKKFYIPLLIGIVLIIGLAFLMYVPLFKNNSYLRVLYYCATFLTLFILIYFTVDGIHLSGSLFVLSLVISLQHICYKITLGLFILINPAYLTIIEIYLPAFAAVALIGYACSFFFISKKLDHSILMVENKLALFGVFTILIVDVFMNFFTYDLIFVDFENNIFITSLINFAGIVTTVLALLFLYTSAQQIRVSKENALLKLISDKDRERYELAKISIDEINLKYHDLKHTLENKNLDAEAAKEIKETITNYKAFVNTSNKGLNVVIYESQLKCISKEIDLNVLIDGDPLTFMKSHHVYSLLSNLLDNSIEAVENCEPANKRIFLNICKKQDNTIIKITNYCSREVKFKDGYPVTSKKDSNSHGFGIRSVENIVNRYNGNFVINTENQQFTIEILLPNY